MDAAIYPVQIRWSDLDPNFHLRHSVYYDWGAYSRILFLDAHGLTADVMRELHIGPIIFREECVFKKEIRLGDEMTVDLQVTKAKKDFSRWSVRHHIIKNREVLSAILTLDLAWINTIERKLAVPPQQVSNVIESIPKHERFEWSEK